MTPFWNVIDLISLQLRENFVCLSSGLGRWNGCLSKQERPATNRKLTEDQGIAVCQCIDRLDTTGTSSRMIMITSWTDFNKVEFLAAIHSIYRQTF